MGKLMKSNPLFVFFCAVMLAGPACAVDTPQPMKETAKDEAIYRASLGKAEDVKMLVEKLGNANIVDDMGWPLLAIAAARTDPDAFAVVQALVEAGADVNYHGGRMNYPIMFAVQSGNAEIVKFLLEQGANYRVTDPYGVRLVDYARQSGDPEVIEIIEDAVNNDVLNLARVRSQQYLDQISFDLAYNACALQYYTYYYSSGQDAVPLVQQNEILEKHKLVIGRSIGDLVTLFRLPQAEANNLFHAARKEIFTELEGLISNRWRRIKGIGQPGDMEERCTRLTEKWKKDVFNKEKLDARIK